MDRPRTDETFRLHAGAVEYLATHGLVWPNLAEPVSFDRSGVAFTLALIDEPAPALWVGCDIGPVRPTDAVALRWLLQESFEPWAYARIHFGCDMERGRAVAIRLLSAPGGERLAETVELLAAATDLQRRQLARGAVPDVLFDPMRSEMIRL